jgi:hypothetical protein
VTVTVTVPALVVNIEVSLEKCAEIRSCCSDRVPVEVTQDIYCSILSRDQIDYQNLLLYENKGVHRNLPIQFSLSST